MKILHGSIYCLLFFSAITACCCKADDVIESEVLRAKALWASNKKELVSLCQQMEARRIEWISKKRVYPDDKSNAEFVGNIRRKLDRLGLVGFGQGSMPGIDCVFSEGNRPTSSNFYSLGIYIARVPLDRDKYKIIESVHSFESFDDFGTIFFQLDEFAYIYMTQMPPKHGLPNLPTPPL